MTFPGLKPVGFCRGAEALGHGPIRAVTGSLAIPKEWPSRLVFLAWMPASVTSNETGARAPVGNKRDTFYLRAFPVEPRERIVYVKVLCDSSTTVNALSSVAG